MRKKLEMKKIENLESSRKAIEIKENKK